MPRGLALTWALFLVALAAQVWLGRYELLLDDHTIFAGATYTDVHVRLTAMTIVAALLVLGALVAASRAMTRRSFVWLAGAAAPAAAAYLIAGAVASYVSGFIVKPNELVRERPYIEHNIAFTRQAYGLNRIVAQQFPAEGTVAAADPAGNTATLQNIRLWDWRVLQDTLRQLQEIRTYYDFPDIDIDRYTIDGAPRQVMLATRELNVDKLPESSRNWINEKLIYTHGYGITMNYVNGFTPEGLPQLLLKDMPVQSTTAGLTVTRPEIYFGETTDTDVYVNTRQQEFNYPQGETNSLTSYEGTGGIVLGGYLRRLLIATERGDIAKLPFSDDVGPESRLLMRRNVRARAAALAPFLTFDDDPYMVLRADGRLAWMMDAFTVSDRYPYSRRVRVGAAAGQLRPQQREGRDRRLRRIDDVLRLRPDRSDHRRVSRALSGALQGRGIDARGPARARPVSRAAAFAAGRRLRPVPHDRSRGFLQSRGSLDGGDRRGDEPAGDAGNLRDGAELRRHEAARRDAAGVRRDAAVLAGQSQQPDRLDRRAQ